MGCSLQHPLQMKRTTVLPIVLLLQLCFTSVRSTSSPTLPSAGEIILLMQNAVFLLGVTIPEGDRLAGWREQQGNGVPALRATPVRALPWIMHGNTHIARSSSMDKA